MYGKNLFPCLLWITFRQIIFSSARPTDRAAVGHRYRTLFRTPHGEVKETRENIIFQLRFPKHFGKILIVSMLHDEHLSILSFLKSYRKLYKPRRMKKLDK